MITIIEKRSKPDPLYQMTCSNCTSVFRFNKSDGTPRFDQREGKSWDEIKCPVCERTNVFSNINLVKDNKNE